MWLLGHSLTIQHNASGQMCFHVSCLGVSLPHLLRSGKLQNESFPIFLNFRPEFCPEFCSEIFPNFSRTFRALFRGRRRPEKIHQKSLPFFNAKFPGKHEKNIHKILLETRQSNTILLTPSCCQENRVFLSCMTWFKLLGDLPKTDQMD